MCQARVKLVKLEVIVGDSVEVGVEVAIEVRFPLLLGFGGWLENWRVMLISAFN